MGSLTNYAEQKMLDHLCLTAYTPASTLYVALCTADPTDAATGASMNEVNNANGYARTAITFGAAASRAVTQSGAVTFPQASGGGWGTASYWAIVDTNTYGSGNALAHGAFGTAKVINDGNTPSIASAEINVTVSAGDISNYAANAFLDRMFRNQAFTIAANYIALVKTSTITDSDTGSTITEPSGGAYARKQVNANGGAAPDWDLAVSGDPSYVDNNDEIAFPTATADWGTIIAVGNCDASSGGNLLTYDNDMTDQDVNTDDTAKFAAGALKWQAS